MDRMLSRVKNYPAKMHYDMILEQELGVSDSCGAEIIPFAVLVDRNGKAVVAIQSIDPEPLKLTSDAIDRLRKEPDLCQ